MIQLTQKQKQNFEVIYNYLKIESTLPLSADAIIVGGSGTRVDMAERAVELYNRGIAPIIVFSGFAHPKFNINEADLLAEYAIAHGVPETAIIRELKATNTGLNIQLAQIALANRLSNTRKIILVHKPYMTRRFLATAEAQWSAPKPKFYVTSVDEDFDAYFAREEQLGLGEVMLRSMLKDYAVMKTHPHYGYQTAQPVDDNAERAYKELLEEGFTEQAINHDLATQKFHNQTE